MEDKDATLTLMGGDVAEINIMMNAGSVTTAIAITNALYQLLTHPEPMAQLRQEIDTALEIEKRIPHTTRSNTYHVCEHAWTSLFACCPPTPNGLPGRNPLGQYVPGNTIVSVSALVAQRHETVFPNAEEFIPERFLDESGKSFNRPS